jgi:hypothetical protein
MNEKPNKNKRSKEMLEKKLKEESKQVKANSIFILKDFEEIEEIDNIDKTTKKC